MNGKCDLQLNLSDQQIHGIVNFLGYGRRDAPIWFVGIEEGLGIQKEEEVKNNVYARTKFDSIMDLREAHERLIEDGRPIDIVNKASFTAVWVWMAKIVLAHRRQSWDLDSAKNYVRTKLGRRDGETFLTELSPVPSARTSDKKWSNYFKQYGSASLIEERQRTLRKLLAENQPQLVICYGKAYGSQFSHLLQINWEPVQTNASISKSMDSKCVLLPFFGNGRMSGSVIEALLQCKLIGV
jgi:hypothetical protein